MVYTDSIPWKLFYVAGCLFVAMQNMEDWEEAVFDKTKNRIELKTFSLYAVVLTLWSKGQEKGLVVQRVCLFAVLLECKILKLSLSLFFKKNLSPLVVLDLTQLCDICVQEEKVRYLGTGHVLMLRVAAGFSYPLTQSATLGGRK